MDKTSIYTFMAGYRYGVVSSIAASGVPQAALMGIAVTPELEICLRYVEFFEEVQESDRAAFVLVCRGMGRGEDYPV